MQPDGGTDLFPRRLGLCLCDMELKLSGGRNVFVVDYRRRSPHKGILTSNYRFLAKSTLAFVVISAALFKICTPILIK